MEAGQRFMEARRWRAGVDTWAWRLVGFWVVAGAYQSEISADEELAA